MLTRRNADIAPLYAELTARDVPVEIVGLGGLLQLPEIMDVTATLRLIDDVTANPDLIRLLTGPRWRIGPRDLALLGRRARELARAARIEASADRGWTARRRASCAGASRRRRRPDRDGQPARRAGEPWRSGVFAGGSATVRPAVRRAGLAAAAQRRAGARPDPPGDHHARPGRRADGHPGVRCERPGATSSVPSSTRSPRTSTSTATPRCPACSAYLQAEIEQGAGLEQAVPSDREAVKLLTVHKAKGLEWEVVFLPALMKGVFPSDRVTDNWVTNPAVLPADLRGDAGSIPQLAETTYAGMADVQAAAHRAAAAGRGPAGLRRRHPGQAAAGRHRPLLAGRSQQPAIGLELPSGDHRGSGASGSAGRRGCAARPRQSAGDCGAPQPWPPRSTPKRRLDGRTRRGRRARAAPIRRDRGATTTRRASQLLLDDHGDRRGLGRRPGPAACRAIEARSGISSWSCPPSCRPRPCCG